MTSPPRALEWIGDADGFLRVLDQTALPDAETTVDLRTPDDVIAALRRLAVRGAPAIGVAGAYAVVLGLRGAPDSADALSRVVADVCAAVESARPTAVNLAWAVRRVRRAVDGAAGSAATRRAAFAEARAIEDEDRTACARMAAYGATLIGPGERVLTCCNTGALATAGEGTALGAILATARAGRRPTVYACETRPLLQGSRLTMWELGRAGVDAVLLCDNAAAEAMRRGLADRVMVGADRVARNGDVANKIGTYGLATLARAHGVPFHVVAPWSTVDLDAESGARIPLEERSADEVTSFGGRRVAPAGVRVFAPAFDVTPAALVTSLVTDRGILAPLDAATLAAAAARADDALSPTGTPARRSARR